MALASQVRARYIQFYMVSELTSGRFLLEQALLEDSWTCHHLPQKHGRPGACIQHTRKTCGQTREAEKNRSASKPQRRTIRNQVRQEVEPTDTLEKKAIVVVQQEVEVKHYESLYGLSLEGSLTQLPFIGVFRWCKSD